MTTKIKNKMSNQDKEKIKMLNIIRKSYYTAKKEKNSNYFTEIYINKLTKFLMKTGVQIITKDSNAKVNIRDSFGLIYSLLSKDHDININILNENINLSFYSLNAKENEISFKISVPLIFSNAIYIEPYVFNLKEKTIDNTVLYSYLEVYKKLFNKFAGKKVDVQTSIGEKQLIIKGTLPIKNTKSPQNDVLAAKAYIQKMFNKQFIALKQIYNYLNNNTIQNNIVRQMIEIYKLRKGFSKMDIVKTMHAKIWQFKSIYINIKAERNNDYSELKLDKSRIKTTVTLWITIPINYYESSAETNITDFIKRKVVPYMENCLNKQYLKNDKNIHIDVRHYKTIIKGNNKRLYKFSIEIYHTFPFVQHKGDSAGILTRKKIEEILDYTLTILNKQIYKYINKDPSIKMEDFDI